MDGLHPEAEKERARVLEIVEAHKNNLGDLYYRLWNMIKNGVDLQEEMKRPVKDRAFGFEWPDQQ